MREKGNQPTETTVQKPGCRERRGNSILPRCAVHFSSSTPHPTLLLCTALLLHTAPRDFRLRATTVVVQHYRMVLQDGYSRCWHRADRERASGGGGVGGRTGWRLRRLMLLPVVALAWGPSSLMAQEEECPNGLEGILSNDGTTCCLLACGLCGGEGCSDVEGTETTDCCVNSIEESNRTCGVNGVVAPCTIDPTSTTEAPTPTPAPAPGTPTAQPAAKMAPPAAATGAPALTAAPDAKPTVAPDPAPTSKPTAAAPTLAPTAEASSTCSNGYPGWESDGACCSQFCGQCGGSGCGALGSADCCIENIVTGDLICGVNAFEAPCLIVEVTPAPLAAGETSAPVPPPTAAPVAPTAAPVAASSPTLAPVLAATPAPEVSREIPGPTAAPVAGDGNGGAAATEAPAGGGAPAAAAATEAPVGGVVGTPAPAAEECSEGIEGFRFGAVCCALACGQCGGSGCELIVGTNGASDCCFDTILREGELCSDTVDPPCILGSVDEGTGATDDASVAYSLRISRKGEGGGVASAVTGLAMVCLALYNY
ncbi:unnamed protein product [Pylaiella littoralis]